MGPPNEAHHDDNRYSESQQFVLEGVDWLFYESLLNRVGDRHIFITYDRGRLELMSPSFKHDKRARLLGLLISIVAEELAIPIQGCGSATFRRENLQRGLESDQWFYIRNVDRIRGKDEIDLAIDPPPDLGVEVEISRSVIHRLPIYESMGIGELWRDDGNEVRIFQLGADGHYHPFEASLGFPGLLGAEISRLLALARTMDEMNWTRMVRAWVRDNLVK